MHTDAEDVLTLSPAHMYCHQTELTRERQRRYYAKNKERILATKRDERAILAALKTGQQLPALPLQPDTTIIKEVQQTRDDEKDLLQTNGYEMETTEDILNDPKFKKAPKRDYSLDTILSIFDEIWGVNGITPRPNTLNTRRNAIKRFFEATGCKEANECLRNYTKIEKMLKTEMNPRTGERYAGATQSSKVETVLYMIDKGYKYFRGLQIDYGNNSKNPNNTKGGISILKYKLLQKDFSTQGEEERKEDADLLTYVPMTTLVKMVENTFGENSKEYLLIKMYYDLPVRDDFDLTIISESDFDRENKKNNTEFDNKNYLITRPNGKPYASALFKFKTSAGKNQDFYEKGKKEDFSKKTTELLKRFITDQKLKPGDKLFQMRGGSTAVIKKGSVLKNSQFIKTMLTKVFEKYKVSNASLENLEGNNEIEGGKGSINYLRHSRVSEQVDKWEREKKKPNANKERIRKEAIELSRRMKHSTEQQKKYVRNLDTVNYFI